jgi:hypothetical protein
MTPGEVLAVRSFVRGGGGLILMGDAGYADPNPELASTYGITFNPYTLYSPVPQAEGVFTTGSFVDHPAVKPWHPVTMMWGGSLDLIDPAFWLADTADVSEWRDVGYDDAYVAGVDEVGPFNILGAYDEGCGRVVACADDALGDTTTDWTENDGLMRSLLDWVTGGEVCAQGGAIYLPLVLR